MNNSSQNVAEFLVSCLEAEGVEYVFGIPGEENIKFIRAVTASDKIRFILVRHEQAASFMADIYGRLTGKAGVCAATLGPGAINLLLGTADAQTDSSPLVALSAQVGLNRIFKESHQIVDLVALFKPVTKWADMILTPASVPEMIRKAFDLAQSERPGATYLAIPEDLEAAPLPDKLNPLPATTLKIKAVPSSIQIEQAVQILRLAQRPIILAGHGIARARYAQLLTKFAEHYQIPVATTFMGKGVISDRHPLALGVMGFMQHDYENFAFDQADVILSIGYELQEFDPSKMNPHQDKKIIHLHALAPEIDAHYQVAVSIEADIGFALEALANALGELPLLKMQQPIPIRALLAQELAKGNSDAFPLKPQRIVSDIRTVMADDDIVLADTGAIKMWMSRLYPTYQPLTCIVSNGLSTMAFSLPGAIAAKLAHPNKKILAVMGDGSFLMNSQEIETAIRENIPLKILVWVDFSYGLIKWKMDIETGNHDSVDFSNPDFVQYAASFGAQGYLIESADALRPTLRRALNEPGVSLIACPVDYSENMLLIENLGHLTIAL